MAWSCHVALRQMVPVDSGRTQRLHTSPVLFLMLCLINAQIACIILLVSLHFQFLSLVFFFFFNQPLYPSLYFSVSLTNLFIALSALVQSALLSSSSISLQLPLTFPQS